MSGMHAQAARLAGTGVSTAPAARQMFRGAYLAALLLVALVFASSSAAQVRTAVRDVLYNADGSRASGQIEITWNSFLAADGKTIAAGKITRRITDGVLDVSLVPTEGATPAGASYAVSYVLSSGISYSETWSVPATGPVRLSAVRVLPPVHLPAETLLPLNQLSPGTGLAVLLGLARFSTESAPAPSASGQCYWDTTLNQMRCAQSDLTYTAAAGGSGTTTWGSITGRLENQTDLETALESRISTNTPAGGELSGSYPSPVIGATISGSKTFTGSIDSPKINAIRHAHQFAGADAGAKITAAIADLPVTGGTVDARGLEGTQAVSSDIFSGVTKPVELWLPQGTTTVAASFAVPVNVTLRFSVASLLSPANGTTLTIQGPMDAPALRIFAGSGTVSFSGNKRLEFVYPQWWGAQGDNATDDTAAIQAAEDALVTAGAGELRFPEATYKTTAPLVMHGNMRWIGTRGGVTIRKTTNTAGTGTTRTYPNGKTDLYNVDSILSVDHADLSPAYYVMVKGIGFLGAAGSPNAYGMYAPRTANLVLEQVKISSVATGFYTRQSYLGRLYDVECVSCTSKGYHWDTDGANSTGTSMTFTDTSCNGGSAAACYYIYGLVYSSMNGVAADNVLDAYKLLQSQISLNGAGAEHIGQTVIDADGASGRVTVNGMWTLDTPGTNSQPIIRVREGATLTLNNSAFAATGNGAYNLLVSEGSSLIANNTTLPTGGNQFMSLSGGARLVENNALGTRTTTATATDLVHHTRIYGDTQDRATLDLNGKLSMGAGTSAVDVGIERGGAGVLKVHDGSTGYGVLDAFGYRASGAAAAGAFLRGNGTNFVGSTIQNADLPAPAAGAKGGVEAKTCTGTDKLSAIGTDGLPVCSADQVGGAGGGYSALAGDTGTASKTGTEAAKIVGTVGEIATVAADGSPDDTVTISLPATLSTDKSVTGQWTFTPKNTATSTGLDVLAGTGSPTNLYGLRVAPQTAGTNNWNFWSGPASVDTTNDWAIDFASNVFTVTNSGNTSGGKNYSAVFHSEEDAGGAGINTVSGLASFTVTAGAGNYAAGPGAAVEAYAIHVGSGTNNATAAMTGIAQNDGAGTITTASGGLFQVTKSAGAITNAIGVNVPDITAGDNNWATKTGLGLVEHGDVVKLNGNATSKRQLALPSVGADPASPVSGDLWNNAGALKFYNGATKTLAFLDSSITGNAGTATALASDPGDCTGNNFALGIAANGTAACAQPAFSNLSGSAASGQLPTATNLALGAVTMSTATSSVATSTDDTRLSDARTPTAHVLADTTGLGAQHTTSGLTAGQVLRATGATTAAFAAILGGDLPNPAAGTKGGVEAKTCSGTDKLSAIGTDGVPVCTADQTSAGGGYATIQEEASPLTQRTTLNFIGPAVTAADDGVNTRTNVTVVASGTGACAANTWASTLNDGAAPTCTQPASSNLSDGTNLAKLDAANTFSANSTTAMVVQQSSNNTLVVDTTNKRVGMGRAPSSYTGEIADTGAIVASGTGAARLRLSAGTAGAAEIQASSSGRPLNFTNTSGTTILSLANADGTITNATLDVEGTSNTITTVSKATFVAAGCNNATASPGFDLPTSNAATATCYGTNVRLGALDFADSAVQKAYTHFRLPSDWTGNIDAALKWFTSATTNATTWNIKTGCSTDGTTDMTAGPSLNTAQAVTTNDNGTASSMNQSAITTLTTTGCAAGRTMFIEVSRDNTDTNTATASLVELELTLRRAQ